MITLENNNISMGDVDDWHATQRREEEVRSTRTRCYRFLNSEATLVSCWERSHLKMRTGWLRSEATAVLGSTLLDIHNYIPVEPRVVLKMTPKPSPRGTRIAATRPTATTRAWKKA